MCMFLPLSQKRKFATIEEGAYKTRLLDSDDVPELRACYRLRFEYFVLKRGWLAVDGAESMRKVMLTIRFATTWACFKETCYRATCARSPGIRVMALCWNMSFAVCSRIHL
jgi:hypothetical protein